MKVHTPIKAIRLRCLECCCGNVKEERLCSLSCCPFYPWAARWPEQSLKRARNMEKLKEYQQPF